MGRLSGRKHRRPGCEPPRSAASLDGGAAELLCGFNSLLFHSARSLPRENVGRGGRERKIVKKKKKKAEAEVLPGHPGRGEVGEAFWGLGVPGRVGGLDLKSTGPPHPPDPTSVSSQAPRGGGCRSQARARVGMLLHLESRKMPGVDTVPSRTMAGRVSGARRHHFQTGCPGLAARICRAGFEPYTLLRPVFCISHLNAGL